MKANVLAAPARVLCVGELALELCADDTIEHARALEPRAGGAAFVVASELAARGIGVAVASAISTDAVGEQLVALIRAAGVELAPLERYTGRTELIFRGGLRKGAPTFVGYRDLLDDRALRSLARRIDASMLRDAGVVHAHVASLPVSRGELAVARSVARAARVAGVTLSLDLNARPARWRGRSLKAARHLESLRDFHLVKGSDADLEVLGVSAEQTRACVRPGGALVVTRGMEGATVETVGTGATQLLRAGKRLRDATGAGDRMVADMIATRFMGGDGAIGVMLAMEKKRASGGQRR